MSGADLAEGDEVVVRFVGYRRRDNMLLKAMVSRKAAAAGKGHNSDQDAAAEQNRTQ